MKIKTLIIWIAVIMAVVSGLLVYTYYMKMSPWKIVQQALAQSLFTPDRTRQPAFLFGIGDNPDNAGGGLSGPLGIAAGKEGTVYVANTRQNQIKVYDPNGKLVKAFGENGAAPGQLTFPVDVAVVGQQVLVTEAINGRVQVFDRDGNFIKVLLDRETSTEIGEIQPVGIGVGTGGRIYITDALRHRVISIDEDGKIAGSFGEPGVEPGQFSYPYDVAVDAVGQVFVSDANNGRVQVFDGEGKFLRIIKGSEQAQPFALPRGLAFDSYNRLMVVDVFLHQVLFFEPDGTFLFALGSRGKGDGQYNFPNGIGVGGGRVFVADRDNNRVAVYEQ